MAEVRKTLDVRREVKRCSECGQRFSPEGMFCPFDGTKLVTSEWDPSGDALLQQVIDGRYEVVSVLGEGGMGRVYKVRHAALDRFFAMKVLRKDLAKDEELAQRFIQEAKTTASIHHPNVVSINDFGRLPDETPYFVMELLTGETLGRVIKVGGPVPAGRAVRIIRQLAAALGAAHEKGIVHRDLKPDNVFLVGGAGAVADEVRIVDFGAAKVLGASRLTKAGVVFGTPHYMSPEQASGQSVDHRADLYALGIIMYEMFTGKVPFEADTYMGVLTQHMFVQPVPPSQVNAAAKELGALEEITLRALEKKPEDRYGSSEELVTDLDRVVRRSQGKIEIARHLDGRHSSRPPKSAPFKMADELEPPTLEELRAASDTMVPPRRSTPWAWIGGGVAAVALCMGIAALVTSRRNGETEARAEAPRSPAASATVVAKTDEPSAPAPAPTPAPTPTAATSATVATVAEAKTRVHLVSTPAAEVYAGNALLGTTPTDVAFASTEPARYTLKASGYADQEIQLTSASDHEVKVVLHRLPSAGAATRRTSAAAAPQGGIDDLPNPWRNRP